MSSLALLSSFWRHFEQVKIEILVVLSLLPKMRLISERQVTSFRDLNLNVDLMQQPGFICQFGWLQPKQTYKITQSHEPAIKIGNSFILWKQQNDFTYLAIIILIFNDSAYQHCSSEPKVYRIFGHYLWEGQWFRHKLWRLQIADDRFDSAKDLFWQRFLCAHCFFQEIILDSKIT